MGGGDLLLNIPLDYGFVDRAMAAYLCKTKQFTWRITFGLCAHGLIFGLGFVIGLPEVPP